MSMQQVKGLPSSLIPHRYTTELHIRPAQPCINTALKKLKGARAEAEHQLPLGGLLESE